MKQTRILVVGSYLAGLTMRVPRFPAPGETLIGSGYQAFHGGKGSNQAVACARLGAHVSFAGSIGRDGFGNNALELFRREGIDVSHLQVRNDALTGVGFILVNERGENVITLDLGACGKMEPDFVQSLTDLIQQADMVLCQLEIPLETVELTARLSQKAGTPFLLNPAPWRELPYSLLKRVSVLTPNAVEAKCMCGFEQTDAVEPEALAERILGMGVACLVITLGAQGAYYAQGSNRGFAAAKQVQVVDTTGAGDTFSAALAIALCEGKDIERAVDFAQRAAAISVGRYGVIEVLPYRHEVEC